jgi:gliding motility-associated-like protein
VITVTNAGTYSVTQSVNGCTGPAGSGTAQPGSIPPAPVVNVINNCDGTSTLSTTSTGALLWSNNASTTSITVNAAGTFTVTQTVKGCTSLQGSGTADPKTPMTGTAAAPDIACGQTTGTITVTTVNGIAPFNYSINGGSSWQSSNIFSNLTAGTYTVKIKDGGNCITDVTAIINQLNSNITATLTATDIPCGQSTGTITANASNGSAPYNYSIDGGNTWQASNVFSNLSPGNYVVKVKDAGNCLLDVSASVKQLNSTIAATINVSDIPCGQTTGSITVNASNGAAPYNYSIDGGNTYQSSNTFTGLSEGNYVVRIKDAGNCTTDISTSVKQKTSTITATASASDIPCGQVTGIITVTASNGITPYNYSIDNGANWRTSNIFSGLAAGNYSLRIKDAGGCILDIAAEIKQKNSTLTATVNTIDNPCGLTAGKITVNASNGITPFNYSIDNGTNWQSSNIFSNLSAGNYSIKIKDAGGCMLDISAEIKQLNSTITATVSTVDNPCGQPAGKINVNAANGITPYNYSIDNGTSWQSSNIFSNLAAGNYSIRIKDAGGCMLDISAEIKQLNSTLTATVNAVDNPCGQAAGKITVNAANGIAPYNYSIDNGINWQTSNIFLNLAAGNYSIRKKDAGGCSLDLSATIQQLSSAITANVTVTDVSCSQPAGTIIINAANGIAPYSYSRNAGATWQSSDIFTGLSAGNYIIRIKDAGGCTFDKAAVIKQTGSQITASLNASDITCIQKSGTITISAANGTSPYGYSINGGTSYQASNIFNNLLATNYVIRVRDALGCFLDAGVTIKQNNAPPVIKITDPSRICEPGTVNLTLPSVTAGSESGLAYSYFSDASLNTQVIDPGAVKTGGIYYIKAMKSNGCVDAKPVTVTIPPKSVFSISPGGSICNNDPVQLKASGGTSYLWQPSNATAAEPVVKPAVTTTYTVKIKDSICNDSTVLTTTIKVLSLPTVKATKSNDVDCANDFSQLNATGAKRYTWQPASTLSNPNTSNPVARPVNKTLYTVTGYDSSGCRNTDTITVNVDMNALNKSGYSMPTAFTPNNDGLNDCFGLKYWGAVSKLSFSIFNRFGERIFYSTDPARSCWDGRYKGVMQEVGAYVYFIQATTPCEVVTRKGTVMILR